MSYPIRTCSLRGDGSAYRCRQKFASHAANNCDSTVRPAVRWQVHRLRGGLHRTLSVLGMNRSKLSAALSHMARKPLTSVAYLSQAQRAYNWMRQRGRRNAVFIHVPKTAGMTVAHDLDICELVSILAVRYSSPWKGRLSFGHMHFPTLCRMGYVPGSYSSTAFTFAFVRNSWDRMVSLFHYLQRRRRAMHPSTSFRSFLYLVRDNAYDPPALFNAVGISQAATQLAWLRDADREFPDFIGRYENLATDLATVAGELGCPHVSLRTRINQTTRGHYRDYYDSELATLVAKVYEEEIDRFRFRF
jgi:hypothetical protein